MKQKSHSPAWFRRSAVYQINPRTFSPQGTLKAVTRELPLIASLGFYTVYLCPVFSEDACEDPAYLSKRQVASGTKNPKNPYRMNDYFSIDEEYGTMDDLRELVDTAHELGQRVLLDLVYLHIGPHAPILKKHPEFARRDTDGRFICTEWHFPYLDFDCEGLREYLWSNMVYYVGALDVDGFRCDVGDQVPLDFWAEGLRRIQSIKPDVALICEGSKMHYLTEAFAATYCFGWHTGWYDLLTGAMTPAEFCQKERDRAALLPTGGLYMRDMDNHDTVTDWPCRIETLAGHDGMELIQVMNFLVDGVPMVYAGNELADSTRHNMFANRFFPGNFSATDRERIKTTPAAVARQAVLKKLNALRNKSATIQYGQTIWPTSEQGLLVFKRALGRETVLVVGNPTDSTRTFEDDSLPTDAKVLLSACAFVTKTAIQAEPKGYAVVQYKTQE